MRQALPKPLLAVGVSIKAAGWNRALPRASRLARNAALAAFAAARPRLAGASAEAAVVLAGDALVRALNRDFRGRDKPTNVLAFAAREGEGPPPRDDELLSLGDVVIAFETARAEAKADGKPLADHLRHLVVHGMLHLLGHDHRARRAARRMERLEAKALGLLDVPDPYAPGGARRRRRRGR